jgi:Ca2+-binding RTX toxin-like protein
VRSRGSRKRDTESLPGDSPGGRKEQNMLREETGMNRAKAGKRVMLMLAAAGTMLLLTCGVVLAAEVIKCEPNHGCKGTARADAMSGSQAGDKMMGKGSKDNMRGNQGADTMNGGLGLDMLRGGFGKDTLFGLTGNDILKGDSDDDTIDGGPGSDTIDGGPGNDTILADDGELDSISCGLGEDVVFVDLEDLDAEGTDFEDFIRLTSCETINEPELPVEG